MATPDADARADEVRRLFAELDAAYARLAQAVAQSFSGPQPQIAQERENASALIARIRDVQRF